MARQDFWQLPTYKQGMLPKISPVGDLAVRLEFGVKISPHINDQIRRFCHYLQAEPIWGVTEWIPSYATVTVYYQPWTIGYSELCRALEKCARAPLGLPLPAARKIRIPVCYDEEFGPDLNELAAAHDLTPAQVIERHTSPDYLVYFLGFLPGFPYLGGLPPSLATPRRASPRLRVPAGAVGIAGAQTGVYPMETPGGWQIIGRTPLSLYVPDRQPPALLGAGDYVRFFPITAHRFEEIANGAC